MKTLFFRCKLLTDIVLNQRAATDGNQESLDFIPGNNFLGIAAGRLYNELKPNESLLLFHSGKVRFGDAHPEQWKIGENGEWKMTGKRSLRIPASFYKSKLGRLEDGLYIHHKVIKSDDESFKDFQPKQCRTGFYIFENEQFEEIKTEKSFAIKSAYDREKRRSKDEMMYGYESLIAGSTWLFEVAIDDDDVDVKLIEKVKTSLLGKKRVGRSRTAQYGLVEISEEENRTMISTFSGKTETYIYADARLIFLDEYGLPTFQPTAGQLGFKGGTIDWSNSQIRTFQYAPWNFKRQSRDADRCGIEKGSVFVVNPDSFENSINQGLNNWIGNYQNEGFGKVIINPDFLQAEQNTNGKAKYKFVDEKPANKSYKKSTFTISENDNVLLKFLKHRNNQEISKQAILYKVNGFVVQNKDKYTSESFASQWGTIRSIAMQYKTKKNIMFQLFEKTKVDVRGNTVPDAYLTHGVAKDKWDERGRREIFKRFISQFSEEDFQSAVINLSAEMAKISKKGGNK